MIVVNNSCSSTFSHTRKKSVAFPNPLYSNRVYDQLTDFLLGTLNKYIGKLVRAGHSVAVALQDEDKQRHIEEIIRVQVQQVNKE